MKNVRVAARRIVFAGAIVIACQISAGAVASVSLKQVCDQPGHMVWELPLTEDHIGQKAQAVFSSDEFGMKHRVIDLGDRMRIVNGPNNLVSLKMSVPRGETKRLSAKFDAFKGNSIRHACLSLRVYLSAGFDFDTASTKLGWGLWGGGSTNSSGGIPPEMQKGWTVRNATNGRHGSKIYSYHLNRNKNRINMSRCAPYGCMFGKTSVGSGPLPSGRWFDVNLEVKVNDLGKANGLSRMWIDGQLTAVMDGLVLDDGQGWLIQGLQITDMWGGDTSNKKNHSPVKQAIWYTDYKIYNLDLAAIPVEPERAMPEVELTQLSPQGEVLGQIQEFVWQGVEDAREYHLKIVNDKLATLQYHKFSPADVNCSDLSQTCSVELVDLPAGEMTWRLRYRSSTQRSNYIDMSFRAVDGQAIEKAVEPKPVIGHMAQLSPKGRVATTSIDLVWDAATSVAGYDIKIINRSNGQTIAYTTLPNAAADCGFEPGKCRYADVELPEGKYRWNLRSVDVRTRSAYLKTNFDVVLPVVAKPPASTKVAAVSPAGTINDKTPELVWTANNSADRYFVKVVKQGSQAATTQFSQSVGQSACDGSKCRLQTANLPAGKYQWLVRDVVDGRARDYRKLSFRIR